MKVAALTSGPQDPASRFRVRQHLAGLAARGIAVREYTPPVSKYSSFPGWPQAWRGRRVRPLAAAWFGAKVAFRLPGILGSHAADATWLEREFIAGYATAEFLLKKPVVLDVDDAIWLSPPHGEAAARKLAANAQVLLAGNEYIADWFSGLIDNIVIIPTAVDTGLFTPASPEARRDRERFVIGWIGLASNLENVRRIEKPLGTFLRDNPDAELLIVAEHLPAFREIPSEQVRFVPWSPAREAELVRGMDVGIMPLPDTPWSRGKCSFKMLQYMACGVPVVVSPVGMNAEILRKGSVGIAAATEGEWWDALRFLKDNPGKGQAYGEAGREIAIRDYDRERITGRIAEVFLAL